MGILLFLLLTGVQETTLKNGMKVIIKEDHSVPLVNVTVVVKSGSVYESDSTLGMTHFLEHLCFDGTRNRTRQQIRDRFDELGTYFNAFTREDFTAYIITAPTEYVDEAIEIQADMILNSNLPPKEFEKEKNVVIQEMHKDRANPQSVADEIFKKVVFEGTPYSEPVLGYEETIKNVKRETVLRYYHTYYRPDNMIAVVIGDVNPKEIIKTLESAYGSGVKSKLPPPPEIEPFNPKGAELTTREWGFPVCYAMIAFPAFPSTHELAPALEVAVDILNSSSDSPFLKRVLYNDSPLVTDAYFSYERHLGFDYITLVMKTDSVSKAQRAISMLPEAIDDLKKVDNHVVERAKTAILSNHAFESENITYEGMGLTYWVALGSGYSVYENYYKRLAGVSKKDVIKAISRVFEPLRYRGLILKPKGVDKK